jgi:cysteine desulfurase/selenocysteine lyase
MTDWEAVRRCYPAAGRRPYLDTAVKGLPHPDTLEAVGRFSRFIAEAPGRSATEDTLRLIEGLDDTRRTAAGLIGATSGEIALVESTQHGMNAFADAVGLRAGDRVVTDDLEFFAAYLPWAMLARRGVELEVVSSRDGRVEVEDIAEAINERTRAVAVSSVQEVNGYCIDLEALGRVCRGREVLLVADGTQHAGPVALDVRRTPVDALAVGAHKWLCSPFGTGFLYVRRETLERLQPTLPGYMSLATPPGGWDAFLSDPDRRPGGALRFVSDARKLEVGGTAPYVGAVALAAAIRALSGLGLEAVRRRVEALVERLLAGLDALGAELTSPREPEHRAAIVSFRTGRGIEADRALHRALLDAGVSVSLRFTSGVGGIRVSPWVYNDEGDIDRVLEVAETAV